MECSRVCKLNFGSAKCSQHRYRQAFAAGPASPSSNPFDLELKKFGKWTTDPMWVPPKDTSREMAETMFRQTRLFDSPEKKWQRVIASHRNDFTQVREIELFKSSIRLPQGRLL